MELNAKTNLSLAWYFAVAVVVEVVADVTDVHVGRDLALYNFTNATGIKSNV